MVVAVWPRVTLQCQAVPGVDPGWQFVIEDPATGQRLAASDSEPDVTGERLELLSVVRGLEALWEPSLLTLITPSRYVRRGLTFGLDDWRSSGWQWESFGRLVPIKHADLWQRVDQALRFHRLDVRHIRVDRAHGGESPHRADPRGGVPRPWFLRRGPRGRMSTEPTLECSEAAV